VTHLLVTNDFPPKVGGIQVYLWELWRRLDPDSFAVLTASSHPDATNFDATQRLEGIRIDRLASPVLLPTPQVARSIRKMAGEIGAGLVVIDPAFPLGFLGPMIGLEYAVILHGAEIAVPGRLPAAREMMRTVLSRATLAICAGEYPAAEVKRICGSKSPRIVVVPPGVDTSRFRPLPPGDKVRARASLGLPANGLLVTSVSRLVPRKGMDVTIQAAADLTSSFPDLTLAIGGTGRDMGRLRRLAATSGAPVELLGRVSDDALPDLYGAADVFVMACRDRWLGLEQEGFGIVFLESAACGVAQVAGRSGGAAEAVVDGETGFVVDDPSDPGEVASALRRLLSEPELRRSMGEAGRGRVVESYDYGNLSLRLAAALGEMEG
jgi:phosphatidylinositol alpha-1,6-mannosyltransferase